MGARWEVLRVLVLRHRDDPLVDAGCGVQWMSLLRLAFVCVVVIVPSRPCSCTPQLSLAKLGTMGRERSVENHHRNRAL